MIDGFRKLISNCFFVFSLMCFYNEIVTFQMLQKYFEVNSPIHGWWIWECTESFYQNKIIFTKQKKTKPRNLIEILFYFLKVRYIFKIKTESFNLESKKKRNKEIFKIELKWQQLILYCWVKHIWSAANCW